MARTVPGPSSTRAAGAGCAVARSGAEDVHGTPLHPAATVVVALVLLGAGLAGGRTSLRDDSPLVGLAERHATVDVWARVVTEPRVSAFGAWAIVRITRVDDRRLTGRAVIHLDADTALAVGQPIAGRMRVGATPDGGFGAHLRALGVSVSLRPRAPPVARPAPWLLAHTTVLRTRAGAAFDAALPSGRAALLGGIVLGSRDRVDDDILRDAGLSHLVVVSGRHVAVVLAGVLALSVACGIGHRGRHRLALTMLWWFVLVTRWQPSVLRAAVMATLMLAAASAGRGRQSTHSLAVTVAVLLLCDPLLGRQMGFALSVLATAGVLSVVGSVGGERRRRGRIAVRATIAAQITTAPVVLSAVGTVPLGAVPANLVAAPAATIAQVVGLVAAAVAAVPAPGAHVAATWVARAAGPALALVQSTASLFAGWPQATARHVLGAVLLSAGVWTTARWGPLASRARHRIAVVAVVTAWLVTVVVPWIVPASAPDHLRLTALDVGQGDALLVESPGGTAGVARMLVDGGPEPDVLDAALRARRIRSLTAVVLTHGDHDHAGGLARVLRRARVGALMIPAGDPQLRDAASSARDALDVAQREGVPVIEVAAGRQFVIGDATVEVLAPPPVALPGTDRNSRSIVLRVVGPHGSMLLTGDADESAQLRLLRGPAALRADVLKVPHHGGATNAVGFLDAVAARVAVVSVGAGNGYGHPHPDTVDDLAPVPLWRTDRHGALTVTLTPAGPVVQPASSP
ncbi:MAG TPA: ComEC/Rec2 family competence protein [Euzebyales bacterium]